MIDHSASKLKGLAWLIIACLLGIVLAAGLAPLAHIIPWQWEKKLASVVGSNSAQQECLNASPKTQALFQQLVNRIYPLSPEDEFFSIHVHIIRNPLINAYAELGGRITVTSELLEQSQSPEELAGVLSHEIEHVHHRHILEGLIVHLFTVEGLKMIFSGEGASAADWTHYFLTMGFSRTQEAQADEDVLRRLQKAHVDNHGFKDFFQRMKKEDSSLSFVSDHPSTDTRIEMVSRFTNKEAKPIMTQKEWLIIKDYCREQ